MYLTYRVQELEAAAVAAGLRAQGFEAEVSPNVVVGREHFAVVVRDVVDAAEAKAADSVVEIVDQTAVRVRPE